MEEDLVSLSCGKEGEGLGRSEWLSRVMQPLGGVLFWVFKACLDFNYIVNLVTRCSKEAALNDCSGKKRRYWKQQLACTFL